MSAVTPDLRVKALGTIDDRKIGSMVEFGLLLRDGGDIKVSQRGLSFTNGDPVGAMRDVIADVELCRATLEWVHYRAKGEVTAPEIGQYWESTHADTVGGLKGTTLKDGAVCFGRVVEGAGLGSFTVGRGGKETRVVFLLGEVGRVVDGPSAADDGAGGDDSDPRAVELEETAAPGSQTPASTLPAEPLAQPQPVVSVATSPTVHVSVEIHIAADATADTVREIFRNMARYVLDKSVDDDN